MTLTKMTNDKILRRSSKIENDKNDFDKNDNNKIRLTPYGASLIVLDFPVTFHQSCLSPLLSSRPW